jgi:antitoxin PrlF
MHVTRPTAPHSTLRARGQLTLPASVRETLHLTEGDEVIFAPDEDGGVRLIPARVIPADQAWFWTPEWLAGELEVSRDIAAGNMSGPMTADEFVASLVHDDAADV